MAKRGSSPGNGTLAVGTPTVTESSKGLTVKAYRGDHNVMLAFDLDQAIENLAGFAVERTIPGGKTEALLNRLNFEDGQTAATTPDRRPWTVSTEAPFQKFRWVDFPADVLPGAYTYTVTAMLFGKPGLTRGPSVTLEIEIVPTEPTQSRFTMGFTRGYLSSQAYAVRFHNAPIRPDPKTIEYSTTRYRDQYEWLGGHARELIFAALDEATKDRDVTVDLFAYDLDEPDVLRALSGLGKRLRAFLDNSTLHTKAGALEIDARAELENSAGAENVRVGHFRRFAHSKVLILKRKGKPYKVLTGSANFSVRGLYVQANNVLVFDDPAVAGTYGDVFESVFSDMNGFVKSELAANWIRIASPEIPAGLVAFSPHQTAEVSLELVADAIQKAKSSVLFAVMELGGSGAVLDELKALAGNNQIFTYGVTQSLTGIKLYKPGHGTAVFAPFAYLKDQVPEPFQQEWSGGAGQVIHHKFVVVDFNGENPKVFAGSSNLAAGGEESNGDNLLAIADADVASAYAVEAIRLVDHYHFRASLKAASDAKPLTLQGPDASPKWWAPYYQNENIKLVERKLFVK